MFEIDWNDFLVWILSEFEKVFITTKLDRAFSDLQTSADVSTVHGHFASYEFKTALLDHIVYVE